MYPAVYAAKTPDKPVYIMGSSGKEVTYRELNDRSNRFAQFLWARGLRPDDHIAIFLENHHRFPELAWAAQRSGLYYTAINSAEWLRHKGSVGRALLGEVHIVGEDGADLLSGESGIIYFANGQQFEYHNDPEKTAASHNEKGWTTLGDVGYVDEDGYLYLTDRKANVIISGGVNIYTQETENILTMHLKVMDVAVFGVPNEEFGEEVKAVVQPLNMAEAGPKLTQELIDYCKEFLASYKCPRSIEFKAMLHRHSTGKLYKRLLKDRYRQGRQKSDE